MNLLEQKPWDGMDHEVGRGLINQVAELANVKKGLVMKSLRACLLGTMQGPDLMTSWGLLAQIGEDKKRLRPRLSEVQRLRSDFTKAKKILNWKPDHFGLRGFNAGLKKTIEWYNNPLNLEKYKSDIYNV